nr:IS5 family transposase [Streptomyces sp. S1D4-11]
MAALAVARRLGLTDEQWARLEPLLPVPTWSGRASAWTKRQLIDGITWRVRVNAPWRDVPECYGSRPAVYALFRRWQRAKAWAQIVTALQPRADTAGLITRDVSVDSTIARAHQHAAGTRRPPGLQQEPPGGLSAEPDDHALGRSRGGPTTKIHLACEQSQKALSLVVTAGQRGDSPQFQTVLDGINVPRIGAGRPRPRPDKDVTVRQMHPRTVGPGKKAPFLSR